MLYRATGPADNNQTLYFTSPSTGQTIYLEDGDRLISSDGFACVLNDKGYFHAQHDIGLPGDRNPTWATVMWTKDFAAAWDAADIAATTHSQAIMSWRHA